jgi:hypothetical protein
MIWPGITYECSQEGRKHTSLSFWLLDWFLSIYPYDLVDFLVTMSSPLWWESPRVLFQIKKESSWTPKWVFSPVCSNLNHLESVNWKTCFHNTNVCWNGNDGNTPDGYSIPFFQFQGSFYSTLEQFNYIVFK